MSKHSLTLPQSVQILQFIAENLEIITPIMTIQSDAFRQVQSFIHSNKTLEDVPNLENKENITCFIQLNCLLTLTFYNEVFDDQFLSVHTQKDHFSITWENGINTNFSLGVYNQKFKKFMKSYTQAFAKHLTHHNGLLGKQLFTHITHVLQTYDKTISNAMDWINTILKSSSDKVIPMPKEPEYLMMLISALPETELNLFYFKIKSSFPENLHIEISQNPLAITDILDFNAANYFFAFEKIKVHFNLLYFSDQNDVKEQIQNHSKELITPLLKTPLAVTEIRQNLQNTRDQHFSVLQRFYREFISKLGMLCDEKTYLS